MSLQVPPVLVAEPTICVPLALHALSASPVKLSPMFSLAKPVTVPLVAAWAGTVMTGTNARTITVTNSNDRNRLVIRLIIVIFSSSLLISWIESLRLQRCR